VSPLNNEPIRYECVRCGRRICRPTADLMCGRCRHQKARNTPGTRQYIARQASNARYNAKRAAERAALPHVKQTRHGIRPHMAARVAALAARAALGLPLFLKENT
jgi:hypothetical protein